MGKGENRKMKYYPTNNSRKKHHLPLHRKFTKGKRYQSRCEALEAFEALYYYFQHEGETENETD